VVERERAGDEVVAAAGVREGEVARARWLEAGRRCCRAMQRRRCCRAVPQRSCWPNNRPTARSTGGTARPAATPRRCRCPAPAARASAACPRPPKRSTHRCPAQGRTAYSCCRRRPRMFLAEVQSGSRKPIHGHGCPRDDRRWQQRLRPQPNAGRATAALDAMAACG
jgi:hypothetical protein